MTHTLFIGCGNMGSAMVAGWLMAGEDPASFTAVRPSGTPVPGIRTVRTVGEATSSPTASSSASSRSSSATLAPEVAGGSPRAPP
jgi:pyrroline-5-carboxylate reductase